LICIEIFIIFLASYFKATWV